MTDEELVRANWESADFGDDARGVLAGPYWVCVFERKRWFYGHTIEDAWAAAAEFTRERLEQIRQLAEEIDCMGFYDFSDQAEAARQRIVARLESALADIKQGMRTAPPDGARSNANE